MSNPVIIIGAGSVGKLALEIYESSDVPVYGFLDEDETLHGQEVGEVTVLGSSTDDEYLKLLGKSCDVMVASDETELKQRTVDNLKEYQKVVPNNAFHKGSYVSKYAVLGHGNMFAAGSKVQGFAEIGSYNIFNLNAAIDSGAKIGDYVQVGSGAIINSNVTLEDEVFVGTGAVVVAGVTVGKGARIGAGSVVIADVPEGKTVFGNPAKEM